MSLTSIPYYAIEPTIPAIAELARRAMATLRGGALATIQVPRPPRVRKINLYGGGTSPSTEVVPVKCLVLALDDEVHGFTARLGRCVVARPEEISRVALTTFETPRLIALHAVRGARGASCLLIGTDERSGGVLFEVGETASHGFVARYEPSGYLCRELDEDPRTPNR